MALAIFVLHAQGVVTETPRLAVGTPSILRVPQATLPPTNLDLSHGQGIDAAGPNKDI
jgi:hypothetical protein